MLGRFLLLWLVLASLVAWRWPDWFPTVLDPFAATKPWLGGLIAVTMFAIGSLLPRDELLKVAARWPAVLGGTIVQYTTMPLLAYVVGHALKLDRDTLIGVILVGCVPGAMASNVLTLTARGNVSYSVSLTTSATLLSPIMVPALLWLLLGASPEIESQFDPLQTALSLLLQVVLPVAAGHLLARWSHAFARGAGRIGPDVANLAILWIIAAVVGLNRERLGATSAGLLLALLTINLLGYAAGYAGGRLMRLPDPMRRALTLEIGMQNAGLGTVLALQLFPDSPAAAIPTAAYTFGCMLTGTILAQVWGLAAGRSAREAGESDEAPGS
jgi:BASS family bile acid:Na+ symporter